MARASFSGRGFTGREFFCTMVTLNSRGFRDKEVSESKPPAVVRLAVLGKPGK
jgi:hypothetical protein